MLASNTLNLMALVRWFGLSAPFWTFKRFVLKSQLHGRIVVHYQLYAGAGFDLSFVLRVVGTVELEEDHPGGGNTYQLGMTGIAFGKVRLEN